MIVLKHYYPGAERCDQLLHGMFVDRKRLFIDLLGWDVPVAGAHEIDQFDDAHAHYLIAVGADGGHIGSLRLLPTTRPHILDTIFSDLCPLGVPTGSTTFEITRLCLPQRLGAAGRLQVRNALISAMIDHALASGIARLTGVVEERFRRQVLAMGWLAEPLGPAVRSGVQTLGAFALHIEPDTPERLRWTGIYIPGCLATQEAAA
jgi:N-acyl-L-homoserine lactone synthetase